MCGSSKLPNAAPRRSRFTPATNLICLHANCDSPGDKVKTGRPREQRIVLAVRPGRAPHWHAAKLRLTRVFFPIGFGALVRAGSPDPPVPCDRRSPWSPTVGASPGDPRSAERRLFVERYPGESSGSAVDTARRAGYSTPHPAGVNMLRKATFYGSGRGFSSLGFDAS